MVKGGREQAVLIAITLGLSAACSKDAAPPPTSSSDEIATGAARPTAPLSRRCDPREIVVMHERLNEGRKVVVELLEEADKHPDFDSDGVADLVLVYNRGLVNEPHYLFVRRSECYALVGVIESYMYEFRCLEGLRTNGFCNVGTSWLTFRVEQDGGVDVQMIDGATYAFDGEQYVKIARADKAEGTER